MKLTKEELESIQSAGMSLSKLKMRLGDIEIQKHETLKEIDTVVEGIRKIERKLANKYGEGASFNMTTGELTLKGK